MRVSVLVEQVEHNGFRARSGEPLLGSAEGATAQEAVGNLRALLNQRLSQGATLVELNLASPQENPWVTHAGMFQDDPVFDEVVTAMREQRRLDEQDPDYF